jgi:hypothetical protein
MSQSSSAISAADALAQLDELDARLDPSNSTADLRDAVTAMRAALRGGDEMAAVRLINSVTPLLADRHDCAQHLADNATIHQYQADEEATGAYHVLDTLRFGYGYLTKRQVGSNIQIL